MQERGPFLSIDFIFKIKYKSVPVHSYLVRAVLTVFRTTRSLALELLSLLAQPDACEDSPLASLSASALKPVSPPWFSTGQQDPLSLLADLTHSKTF